eukprot:m51a1_g6255 hypothetical protein (552) ;mRNA; f:97166-99126
MLGTTLGLLLLLLLRVQGCTNVLVTPGASADGSSLITYNADWDGYYGELLSSQRATWPPNATVDIVDFETGKVRGSIAQAPVTYNVVGGMNEYQVAIGETTFGGLQSLSRQRRAILDYENLMQLALQRSTTAREAIAVMTSLVAQYGYASSGESFSISDPKEVWLLEMIGKGLDELGAVWVAVRIPDGFVSSHANQARITTFPRNDPERAVYSADVVSFARRQGLYPAGAPDEQFSFSDVYCPVTWASARSDEARVWSVFGRVAGEAFRARYEPYVLGRNLSDRMPLWVRPQRRLSLNDTMMLMRDHYEGTVLDPSRDVGAQAFGMPYRWHPLTWRYAGAAYVNERTIATQQTAYGFVAQSRSWLPREVGGLLWFTMDDTACGVYCPLYSSSTAVPESYRGGNILEADFSKAWWVFNLVANWAYSRWSAIYPTVFGRIDELERRFADEVAHVDAEALKLVDQARTEDAVRHLTEFTVAAGDGLVREWNAFFAYLFARFRDGDVTDKSRPFVPSFPGYPDAWRKRIVDEDGDRYRVPDSAAKDIRATRRRRP